MKIQHKCFIRKSTGSHLPLAQNEGGSATVVFMALLAIMMILVTAESRALLHLHREVRFLEQQQIKRLSGSQTNTATITSPLSQ